MVGVSCTCLSMFNSNACSLYDVYKSDDAWHVMVKSNAFPPFYLFMKMYCPCHRLEIRSKREQVNYYFCHSFHSPSILKYSVSLHIVCMHIYVGVFCVKSHFFQFSISVSNEMHVSNWVSERVNPWVIMNVWRQKHFNSNHHCLLFCLLELLQTGNTNYKLSYWSFFK